MRPFFSVRGVVLCTLFCAIAGFPLAAQQVQPPASYPHDMTEYGCTHRDDGACDTVPAPPPDYNPLVGTWIRFSLLRNGFTVQPPDAPLYIKFMTDGWWSMMDVAWVRPCSPLTSGVPVNPWKGSFRTSTARISCARTSAR